MATRYKRLRALKPPTAIQAKAARTLRKAVRQMTIDYGDGEDVIKLGMSWHTRFAEIADKMSDAISKDMDKYSRRNIENSLGELTSALTIKDYTTPRIQAILNKHTDEMVGYIKTIPVQYHARVIEVIDQAQGDAQKLTKDLQEVGRVTESRAELIARDQISKFNGALNTARMEDAGIEYVTWRHSGGSGQPRPLHVEYDGEIFALNDPPIIDEVTGERGWAGDLPNCRCFMVPTIKQGGA